MSEEKPRAVVVTDGRMKESSFERHDYVVNAPAGATVKDVETPLFWSNVAYRLRPYDHIEVRADDGTWMAQFMVLGCDRTWARVKLLHKYDLTSADVAMTQAEEFYLKFRGPQAKWSIMQKVDGGDDRVIKDEIASKDDAEKELASHKTAMSK